MHSRGAPVGYVDRRAQPVEIADAHTVQPRRDVSSLRREVKLAVIADDRTGERFRRISTQRVIDIGQMLAIELIKLPVVCRVVLGPVPPVPVASFRDEQLFKGELPLPGGDIFRIGTKEIPCRRQMVPGKIVFLRADPHIEVGVDPGAGNNRLKFFRGLASLQGFRNGQGLEDLVILYAIVEAAEKFASGARVILPGMLTIQNDGYKRVSSPLQQRRT